LDVDVIEVDREPEARQGTADERRLDYQTGGPGVRRFRHEVRVADQRWERITERARVLEAAVVLGRGRRIARLLHQDTADGLNVRTVGVRRVGRPRERILQRAGIARHVYAERLLCREEQFADVRRTFRAVIAATEAQPVGDLPVAQHLVGVARTGGAV